MGSSCSILNDTDHDVWITHGINWDVLFCVTFSFVDLTAFGDDLIIDEIFAAFNEAEACFRMTPEGKIILSEQATNEAECVAAVEYPKVTFSDLTEKGWTRKEILQACSNDALAKVLEISTGMATEDERVKLIKPGEKYRWSGTLYLTKRVYVMNDKLQCDDKAFFTGSIPGSNNVYLISQHFKKLVVDQEKLGNSQFYVQNHN